jgi:hypothetical protein
LLDRIFKDETSVEFFGLLAKKEYDLNFSLKKVMNKHINLLNENVKRPSETINYENIRLNKRNSLQLIIIIVFGYKFYDSIRTIVIRTRALLIK